MNFSRMLEHLKDGDEFTRTGWNGKDLKIGMVEDNRCCNGGWIGFYKNDVLICPWTASQSDLLADDWSFV